MTNYEAGEAAALELGMKAVRVLMDKLAAAKRDSAEWKEQHENLLAMFRASEKRAAEAEAALKALRTEELPKPLFTEAMLFGSLVDWCHETFDLRAYGVSRMADNEQAILVSFSRKPSDDELRALHEVLAGRVTKPVSPQRRICNYPDCKCPQDSPCQPSTPQSNTSQEQP